MTKKEMLKKLYDISERLDGLADSLKENHKECKELCGLIQELPAEVDEIDDDEDEKGNDK